jgi:hypothetical protein
MNTIADADKIGMWAAGATTAGVLAHGVMSAFQKKRREGDIKKCDDHDTNRGSV